MKHLIHRNAHHAWEICLPTGEQPNHLAICPKSVAGRIGSDPNKGSKWGKASAQQIWQRGVAMWLRTGAVREYALMDIGGTIEVENSYTAEQAIQIVWDSYINAPGYYIRWWEKTHLFLDGEYSPYHYNLPARNNAHVHAILSGNPAGIYNHNSENGPDTFQDWVSYSRSDTTEWILEAGTEEQVERFKKAVAHHFPKGLPYKDSVWDPNPKSFEHYLQDNDPVRLAKLVTATEEIREQWLDWCASTGETLSETKKKKIVATLSMLTHTQKGLNRKGWWVNGLLALGFGENQAEEIHYQIPQRKRPKHPQLEPWMWSDKYLLEIEAFVTEKGVRKQMSSCFHPKGAGLMVRWMLKYKIDPKSLAWAFNQSAQKAEAGGASLAREYKRNPDLPWKKVLTDIHQAMKESRANVNEAANFARACSRDFPIEIAATLVGEYV